MTHAFSEYSAGAVMTVTGVQVLPFIALSLFMAVAVTEPNIGSKLETFRMTGRFCQTLR